MQGLKTYFAVALLTAQKVEAHDNSLMNFIGHMSTAMNLESSEAAFLHLTQTTQDVQSEN